MALSQRGTVLSARLAPMFRDVTALVRPRSVAVVGASSRRVSQGNLVITNLKEWGFPGPVIPVHPTASSIDDLHAVSSPESLPEGIDLAVVAIPAAGVGEALHGLERAGVRAAIVFANGFSREDEDALRRFTRTSRIVVQGPNCMGLINFTDGLRLYPTRPSERVIAGNVALVAQSGSAAISIMNSTAVGFSKVITVGSEFQVTAADYVTWLAGDAATSVIGVVTERIAHPVAFAEAAESAHAAGKAVIVLNVGTSSTGTAAAAAHTGALIGERDAYDCYFDACDIATVRDYDELIASLECRSVGVRNLRAGARLAVVGISGGQTALACDVAEQASVPLAGFDEATKSALQRFLPGSTGENPVDIGATVIEEERRIREAADAVLADPNVDGLALIQDAQSTLNPRSLASYEPILTSYGEAGRNAKKPVVMISPTSEALHETVTQKLTSHGVPVVRGLREGFVAIGNLSKGTPGRAGRWAQTHGRENRELPSEVAALGAEIERDPGRLLDLYGIPRVRSILVGSEAEGRARCGELGFPMVVKLVSKDVPHRSDVGGVVLGVEDEEGLTTAITSITAEVTSRLPHARIDGFELQEEIRSAVEAMAGFTRSPPFGALVAVGTGGTMVELDADRALGLAPLSVKDTERMIRKTRLGRLLGGYRNLIPNTNLEPLARLVSDLSRLAADLGDTITACDLNPVLVQKGSGAVRVVDVLVIR
ncbi:MAG TPA: acetate--CoA ligase family protein [Vicinamibacteria bacterium]|nr:acetate--CoA ligase family protein [Vicinamibacteria bacterium]